MIVISFVPAFGAIFIILCLILPAAELEIAAPGVSEPILVSLPEQVAQVYRNDIRIGVSTISSSKPGQETPTGMFVILQKDRDHHSSIHNNASMPDTVRLTWGGVALHAGGLPGYTSSHGRAHLPPATMTCVPVWVMPKSRSENSSGRCTHPCDEG